MRETELNQQLHAFVEEHPSGWDHSSWVTLLANLESQGADVSDPERIGHTLERARLADALKRTRVQGLGPKRIQAVVERFETLWNLRHASVEQIAEIPTVSSKLAAKVHEAMD